MVDIMQNGEAYRFSKFAGSIQKKRNDKFFIILLFLLIGGEEKNSYDSFSKKKTEAEGQKPLKSGKVEQIWQIRKISGSA